jgi:hypothetical protein
LIQTLKEAAREFLSEASQTAVGRFRDAVRPIYGATAKGEPDHIGSAVLLDLDGTKCLLTAAHVLDQNAETSLYLGADQFALLTFNALVTALPEAGRDADRADFAIARLMPADVANLSQASFITRADISVGASPSEGRSYTCLGFPNSKNKTNRFKSSKVVPQLGIYSSIGRPASHLPDIATQHDHVLVEYNPQTSLDELGNMVSSISIRGFSGGAIIDLGMTTPEGLSLRSEPKLSALLIEMHPGKKVILGTRLNTILAAIEGKL